MNYINLNGNIVEKAKAVVSPDNSAFRYGYGLFETMLVRDGRIELCKFHWDRLFSGLAQLNFDIPDSFTAERLEDDMLRTVRENGFEHLCRVRLQAFARTKVASVPVNPTPEFIIECFELPPDIQDLNKTGLEAGIADGLAKSPDSLSNLKTCNALIYKVAGQQAALNKWDDALICNTPGNIIESTIANIFWIKNHTIYTPPLSEGCISGVMRRYLLEQLPLHGFVVQEAVLTKQILFDADAIFVTNAIRRMKWIRSIDHTEYDIHFIPDIYKALFE